MLVPVNNNNNYEQPKALFVIFLAEKHPHKSLWCHLMLAQSRPDSHDLYWHQRNDRDLYYKCSRQVDPPMPRL